MRARFCAMALSATALASVSGVVTSWTKACRTFWLVLLITPSRAEKT